MLEHTFIHVPKVTKTTERKLWQNRILTWSDFLENKNNVALRPLQKTLIEKGAGNSIDALKRKDYSYFSALQGSDHWRMYTVLKDRACFLDIETTGLSKHHDDITLIGIHGKNGTKIFMNGDNLDKFQNELKKYSMIVTFNGRCFDVPFIKHKFPDVDMNMFHADLRFIMADLGFRGGLKNVEKLRGINRDDELDGVDGFEAVRLWRRYQKGDNDSLRTLKKYLTADIQNLEPLMNEAALEMKKKHFLDAIRN